MGLFDSPEAKGIKTGGRGIGLWLHGLFDSPEAKGIKTAHAGL